MHVSLSNLTDSARQDQFHSPIGNFRCSSVCCADCVHNMGIL